MGCSETEAKSTQLCFVGATIIPTGGAERLDAGILC